MTTGTRLGFSLDKRLVDGVTVMYSFFIVLHNSDILSLS